MASPAAVARCGAATWPAAMAFAVPACCGEIKMFSGSETFRIGRKAGVPVVISHHKVVGVKNYGRSPETLKFIFWTSMMVWAWAS